MEEIAMTDLSVERSKATLLVVLAHPDDESFGTGGTLAMYARQGVNVVLICATRGEVGEMDDRFMRGFNSIAERREAELRCAAEKLGIKEVIFLNYRDSGMAGSKENQHPQALANQPVEKVALEVISYIQKYKPQVVITFDPIGGYRHPDHIAIHKATVQAFTASRTSQGRLVEDGENYAPQKLYFHTIPKGMLKLGVIVLRIFGRDPRKFGKNQDVDLLSLTEVEFPTHARIGYYSVVDIRDQAAECHASQGGAGMTRGPMGWLRRIFGSQDLYMRAYPPVTSNQVEKDLFEGVILTNSPGK